MSTCNEVPALHLPKSQSEVNQTTIHSSAYTDIVFADVREVDRDTLEPILFLLQNSDLEVQRAASAALGNLAVNSMTTPMLTQRF